MSKCTKDEIKQMCDKYNINIDHCLNDIDIINSICSKYGQLSDRNKKNITNLISKAESLIKDKGLI